MFEHPNEAAAAQQLRTTDSEFDTLCQKHDDLDRQIDTQPVMSDTNLRAMKKERLRTRDSIAHKLSLFMKKQHPQAAT